MVRRPPSILIFVLLSIFAIGTLAAAANPTTMDAARKRDRKARAEIFRGSDVPVGAYPFVVAFGFRDEAEGLEPFCGASLIAPLYVLTSAHCVLGVAPDEIALVVGQTEFGTDQGVRRSLVAIAIHPGFDTETGRNDVAVLTLNQPVEGIAPLPLVAANEDTFDTAGTSLILVGWGDTRREPHPGKPALFPAHMKQREVAVVDDATCARQWRKHSKYQLIVDNVTLCTTAHAHGTGDSGGPIFATAGGTHIQVSLVSSAFGGDRKRNVSNFGPELSAPEIRGFIAAVAGV
jgi:secreted trypsin-like serine protease